VYKAYFKMLQGILIEVTQYKQYHIALFKVKIADLSL